jgi:hypothetical protein
MEEPLEVPEVVHWVAKVAVYMSLEVMVPPLLILAKRYKAASLGSSPGQHAWWLPLPSLLTLSDTATIIVISFVP